MTKALPFRLEAIGRVHQLFGDGVDLADQRLRPDSDRRNVVELIRIRELRELARRFAAYRYRGEGPEAA